MDNIMDNIMDKVYKVSGAKKVFYFILFFSAIITIIDYFVKPVEVNKDVIFDILTVTTPFLITFRVAAKKILKTFCNTKQDLYDFFLLNYKKQILLALVAVITEIFSLAVCSTGVVLVDRFIISCPFIKEWILLTTILHQFLILFIIIKASINKE